MKRLFLSMLAVMFLPVFICSQSNTVLGREGKIMQSGSSFYDLIKDKNAKENAQALAEEDSSRLDKALNNAKQAQDKNTSVKKVKITPKKYKDFLAEEIAQIPAEQKAKWDEMAKNKKFDDLVKVIKSFSKKEGSYDKEKFYILTAVVKVNGKGLVSLGTEKIADAILITTSNYSYAYREAKKIKNSIVNSGMAL